MSVTLSTIGVVLVLLSCVILGLFIAILFVADGFYIRPKKKVETNPDQNTKPWPFKGLRPPTPAERKRRREEKHIELMERSYKSLVPQVEFILKKYGWAKGNDNLWSNKNHTNLTFNEAMEEHNLLVLENVIAHTEHINKT